MTDFLAWQSGLSYKEVSEELSREIWHLLNLRRSIPWLSPRPLLRNCGIVGNFEGLYLENENSYCNSVNAGQHLKEHSICTFEKPTGVICKTLKNPLEMNYSVWSIHLSTSIWWRDKNNCLNWYCICRCAAMIFCAKLHPCENVRLAFATWKSTKWNFGICT